MATACSGTEDPVPSGTTVGDVVQTPLPPITEPPDATTTTTLLPPVTSGAPLEGLEAEIEALLQAAEEVRGLGFLIPPRIEILNPAAFTAAVTPLVAARLEDPLDGAFQGLYDLVGLPTAGAVSRSELASAPTSAWYDATSETLLVADPVADLLPAAKAEIVHEVIHALTNQHYSWSDARLALAGSRDRLRALDALIEGDATYFELVYIQSLSQDEQEEIAQSFRDAQGTVSGPVWLLREVIFPFDQGFEFVSDLVAAGGIAAVDRAYLEPPTTSEQILHPERYRRGEQGLDAGEAAGSLDGYEPTQATMGEFGLRLLLEESLTPGVLTQTADGWGGDAYQLFTDGAGEIAFAYLYLGDGESHTAEVTQAFIDLAESVVGLSDGERSGGGEVYSRSGRPWFFLDREGAGLLVIIASEASAGRALQEQLAPPS